MKEPKPIPKHTFAVDADVLSIDGLALSQAVPLSVIQGLLGPADRVREFPERSPEGHAGNQIHFYDRLGVTFQQHHFTKQIYSVTFHFDPIESIHSTEMPYAQTLSLWGTELAAGDSENALTTSDAEFRQFLAGRWIVQSASESAVGERFSLSVEFKGAKRLGGGRSKRRTLVSVSIGLKHNPWDESLR